MSQRGKNTTTSTWCMYINGHAFQTSIHENPMGSRHVVCVRVFCRQNASPLRDSLSTVTAPSWSVFWVIGKGSGPPSCGCGTHWARVV
ncbi:hypothetical protein ACOSQ3_032513 [Xanthoceras sorbifolium]